MLLVAQDFPPDVGGIQSYGYELALRLARLCERFAVIAPKRPGDTRLDATLPFRVYRLATPTPDGTVVPALGAVTWIARRHGFHTALHGQWATVPASLVARRVGALRRVFVAAHGREILYEPWRAVPWAQRAYDAVRSRALGHADGIFPVSRFTAKLLTERGVDAKRIHVVSNGVDAERFCPRDASELRRTLAAPGQRIVLSVARLVRRKGIDQVIEALRHLDNTVYVVVGDGPDRERLTGLVRTYGLEARVRLAGAIRDEELSHYYNACDVFVLAARSDGADIEGFGLVCLEAGACEKPVVALRAGGVPDAVIDGETGVLVAPNDSFALRNALAGLLNDPERAQALGTAARHHILRSGTWDHTAQKLWQHLHAPGETASKRGSLF